MNEKCNIFEYLCVEEKEKKKTIDKHTHTHKHEISLRNKKKFHINCDIQRIFLSLSLFSRPHSIECRRNDNYGKELKNFSYEIQKTKNKSNIRDIMSSNFISIFSIIFFFHY